MLMEIICPNSFNKRFLNIKAHFDRNQNVLLFLSDKIIRSFLKKALIQRNIKIKAIDYQYLLKMLQKYDILLYRINMKFILDMNKRGIYG